MFYLVFIIFRYFSHFDHLILANILTTFNLMIKYVNGRKVSRNDSVKVRSHLAATTDDFIDYVRPTVRKKPNLIIIHSGTNDIQNNVNTLQKIRKVISSIKEYDTDDNIKIALSSIIHRSDHDFEDKINETNRKLENLCKGKGPYIEYLGGGTGRFLSGP